MMVATVVQQEQPAAATASPYLATNRIHCGDTRLLLPRVQPESVALSFWSPPYFVGKPYEAHLTYAEWCALLETTVRLHFPIIVPGGFLVINIADILCFPDPTMPRIQADTVNQKRLKVTRADVLAAKRAYPDYNRYQLADLLGVSEQTVQRRLEHNNVRGGKYATQTRVRLVGGLVEQWGAQAGLYLYDRRVWAKDPAWENGRWHSSSYRSVDEFEYLYVFWKPGITTVDRQRLFAGRVAGLGIARRLAHPVGARQRRPPRQVPLRVGAPGGAPLLRAGRGGARLLCRQRHHTGRSPPRGPAIPRHRPAAGVRGLSPAQLSPRRRVAPSLRRKPQSMSPCRSGGTIGGVYQTPAAGLRRKPE